MLQIHLSRILSHSTIAYVCQVSMVEILGSGELRAFRFCAPVTSPLKSELGPVGVFTPRKLAKLPITAYILGY